MSDTRILIVEDDPFLSKVIGITLSGQGYQVDTADNGRKALDQLEKKSYKLVLLDLVMPVMSGFDVLKELKKWGSKVPVLVFSNLSQDSDRSEVLSLGAKDFFVKSNIPLEEVISMVKRYADNP